MFIPSTAKTKKPPAQPKLKRTVSKNPEKSFYLPHVIPPQSNSKTASQAKPFHQKCKYYKAFAKVIFMPWQHC